MLARCAASCTLARWRVVVWVDNNGTRTPRNEAPLTHARMQPPPSPPSSPPQSPSLELVSATGSCSPQQVAAAAAAAAAALLATLQPCTDSFSHNACQCEMPPPCHDRNHQERGEHAAGSVGGGAKQIDSQFLTDSFLARIRLINITHLKPDRRRYVFAAKR